MDTKKEFADGKFKTECARMVLTNVGNPEFVIAGPGEIWQDQEGVLQYKIFANHDAYRALLDYMGRPGVIGQIIPDGEFFNLRAEGHDSNLWNAAHILPSPRGGFFEGLAHGYINELTQTRDFPADAPAAYVEVRFKGKLDFPCNSGTQTIIRVGGRDRQTSSSLNMAFAEDGNYRFETRHDSNHTVVSLHLPAGELIPATASRVREALQFILGKQLAVMVIETSSDGQQVTRFTSPSADRGHGDMSPPLQFHRFGEEGHIWRMFCNYFRRVHGDASPGWHPISNHIGRVIESTAASLDTEILALGVAVEGLVGECFPGLAPVSADFLLELDAVQAALSTGQVSLPGPPVETVALNAKTLGRINGSLAAMRKPRNSDVLRVFIESNRLPRGFYSSWSDLRNASAHGGGAGGRDIEKILRLKSEVLSLLYSIAFAAINYTGPRTDYSLPGWPTRAWPIPQPLAAAQAPATAPAPVAVPPQAPPPAPQAPANPPPPEPPNQAGT